MGISFQQGIGDWSHWSHREDCISIDFHWRDFGRREKAYWESMNEVYQTALDGLKNAQEKGYRWVLFTHGFTTSGPGKMTSRSEVRRLMRSKASTPYVVKKDCIQYETVFVAAIRPKRALDSSPEKPITP